MLWLNGCALGIGMVMGLTLGRHQLSFVLLNLFWQG